MPQKKKEKKTNKKSHKKKHLNQKQNIIFQSIPNYSSEQFTGHQNNKNNIQYAPAMQQESRTDNLVGDLVSKLIGKIETDGNKQKQQYTQEIQPVSNSNTNSGSNDNTNSGNTSGNTQTVNVYPSSGQATSEGSDSKKSVVETAAGTAITAATGLSTAETAGIAAGVGGGVLALGGGLFAARKKLGQAIKSTFGGKKLGGNAGTSRLVRGDDEYVRGTRQGVNTDLQLAPKVKDSKPGTYAKLQNELDPLHEDFHVMTMAETRARLDKIREQAKQSEQKRQISTPTPTPTPRASPKPTPINLSLSPNPIYIEPIASNLKKRNSARINLSFPSPEITNARPIANARQSGIQQHDGVLTRNLRMQTGEAHTELRTRVHQSKDPEYVSGYDARRRHETQAKVKQLVPVLNLEHSYNKGYFRKELKQMKENEKKKTQLSSRSRSNPFSASEGSATESASERRTTRPAAARMRSTMLSATLTPETNIYVAKSGNKSG